MLLHIAGEEKRMNERLMMYTNAIIHQGMQHSSTYRSAAS
jgi:hypothetical protein